MHVHLKLPSLSLFGQASANNHPHDLVQEKATGRRKNRDVSKSHVPVRTFKLRISLQKSERSYQELSTCLNGSDKQSSERKRSNLQLARLYKGSPWAECAETRQPSLLGNQKKYLEEHASDSDFHVGIAQRLKLVCNLQQPNRHTSSQEPPSTRSFQPRGHTLCVRFVSNQGHPGLHQQTLYGP